MDFGFCAQKAFASLKCLVETVDEHPADRSRLFVTIKVLCDNIRTKGRQKKTWDTRCKKSMAEFLAECAILANLSEHAIEATSDTALNALEGFRASCLKAPRDCGTP